MTAKRFMVDDAGTLIDMQTRDMFDIVEEVCPLLNEQHETIQRLKQNIDELLSVNVEEELLKENEQLKKELLFFYDVANCECSTNWKEDMEKGCKRFFNCTYEEAKEKYGEYDGMWWEIND